MKLELKTLAPYLPYWLKIRYIERNETHIFNSYNIDAVCSEQNHLKPILRPLSDLAKEIEVNGEKFVPLEVIGKIIDDDYKCLHDDGLDYIIGKDVSPRCGCPYDCDCMCYTYDLFYKDFNFYSTVYQDGNPDDIIDEIIHESYELVQKLLEWHFDVFGLIEEGLAIDFNETLTQK